jgi:hypothetical protein
VRPRASPFPRAKENEGRVVKLRSPRRSRPTTARVNSSLHKASSMGRSNPPKTEASGAPAPVLPILTAALAQHRMRNGNPKSGPIFSSRCGTPASLDNILRRQILPVLSRCGHCMKRRSTLAQIADINAMPRCRSGQDGMASVVRWLQPSTA